MSGTAAKINHAKERARVAEQHRDEALATAGFLREALIALLAERGGMAELEFETMRAYAEKGWDLTYDRPSPTSVRLRAVGPPAEHLDVEQYVTCPECAAEVVVDEPADDLPWFVICPNAHKVEYRADDVNERVVDLVDDAKAERSTATGALAVGEDSQVVA